MKSKAQRKTASSKSNETLEETLVGHHHDKSSTSIPHILNQLHAAEDRPTALPAASVMQLQRTIGNRATTALIQRGKKKRRKEPLGFKNVLRSTLMTKKEWQKLTSSTFNKRGSRNMEILEVDHLLGLIDEHLESNRPDPLIILRNIKKAGAEITQWKRGFNDEEEMQKSARYPAFMKLIEQLSQAFPIAQRWVADMAKDDPDNIPSLGEVTKNIRQAIDNYQEPEEQEN